MLGRLRPSSTALVAEILVGSLEVFAEEVGLSEFFVAAVIVAIVGNAAEHGGAVVVAYRGKVKLAAEIALASAAQVAVFLIPAVVLLSWLIDPLALGFRQVEIAALAFGLAVTVVTLWGGYASKARGVILLVAYVVVAVAFYAAGDRDGGRIGLAERRRRPRQRVRRDVELDGRSVVVPDDAEELAELAPFDDAPRVVAFGPEPRHIPSFGVRERLEAEATLAPGEHELGPLRPPTPEHRRDVDGRAVVGPPERRGSRELGQRRFGEVERERVRVRPGARVAEHGSAGSLGTVHLDGRQEPGHRAAVARVHAVAAPVEAEPEPPAGRPPRLVDHRPDARHLVEGLAREHAVVARCEEVAPAARSSTVDHSQPIAAVGPSPTGSGSTLARSEKGSTK